MNENLAAGLKINNRNVIYIGWERDNQLPQRRDTSYFRADLKFKSN